MMNILTTFAECANKVKTALFGDVCATGGEGIFQILLMAVNIFSYGVGAAAVIGVMLVGIQYITARENPTAVAKAKTRLFHIVIGLAAWVMIWGILQFLLPGGLFANGQEQY